MIPISIYLQNGQNFYTFNESYTPVSEVLTNCLEYLKIPEDQRKYYCLYECIAKVSKYEERQLSSPILMGDILSSWEIMKNQYQELITSTRMYLGLKYFPLDTTAMIFPMVCSKLFDIYFNKIYLERFENEKMWALTFQMFFGDFTERPGFMRDKLRLLHHNNFAKLYSDENYISKLIESYKDLSGRSKESCAHEILELGEKGEHENSQIFKVVFRNSNNPNFRDMQENIIMQINSNHMQLFEESSRENILDVRLDEIANWGVNEDIIVISFGDKYEITKMYFLSHSPVDIAEALFNYTNQNNSANKKDIYEEDENIRTFRLNPKIRKTNTFLLK